MRNITKRIAAAFISTIMVAGTIIPVQAMPVAASPSAPVVSDVIKVQSWYRNGSGGMSRHDAPFWREGGRRGWDRDRRGWDDRRGRDYGWYNGHRGYRDYRRGYRQHNGYWFPLAAFATGAIIGGAISQPPAIRNGGINPRHVSWCESRYRSYRAYDNTFQPNNGGRRQCTSPYY